MSISDPIEVEATPVPSQFAGALTDALATFDPVEAGLSALEETYGDFALPDEGDKEGMGAAKTARAILTSHRTGVEATRKQLKDPAWQFGKKVDARAKQITARITALESPIAKHLDEIKAKEKARAAEEARLHREAMVARVTTLAALGRSVTLAEVEHLELGDWNALEKEARAAFETAEAERLERERVDREEKEAESKRLADEKAMLDAEREAFAAKEAAAAKERAELDAQRAELEKAKEEQAEREARERDRMIDGRVDALAGYGSKVSRIQLAEMDQVQFEHCLAQAQHDWEEAQAAAAAKAKADAEREAQETLEREKAATEAAAKEAAARAAELEKLKPQAEKVRDLVTALDGLQTPHIDAPWFARVDDLMSGFANKLAAIADEMEGGAV